PVRSGTLDSPPRTTAPEPEAQSLEPAFLHADRLLAPYGDWRQPMMTIGLLAFDNGVELLLDGPGDGPRNAFAHRDLVDGADRSDFRGGAAEERFVSEVEHFARDHLFENRDVQVAGDLEHRVAGNAGEHRVAEGRGLEHAVAHEEDVFARAFTHVAAAVERDALGVAVHDSFHLDELRVHVIRAGLGHRGERVGRETRPGGNADVATLVSVGAEILAPGVVDDVDLGGRIEGIDTGLAVAAQHDRTQVARPHAVVGDHIAHGFNDVVAGEVHVDPIDLGRIQ